MAVQLNLFVKMLDVNWIATELLTQCVDSVFSCEVHFLIGFEERKKEFIAFKSFLQFLIWV